MHELLNGNEQALAEMNDIFEEHGLERKNVKKNLICYKKNYYEVISIIEPIEENVDIITLHDLVRNHSDIVEDENDISDIYNITVCNDDIEEWLIRAERWYEVCKMLGFKIEKISDPRDWSFVKSDMNTKGFVEFFEKICTRPKEKWFE